MDKLSHDFDRQDLQRFLFSILLTFIRVRLSSHNWPYRSVLHSISALHFKPTRRSSLVAERLRDALLREVKQQ